MLESEYRYIKDEADWAHYCALMDDMGRPFTGQFDALKRKHEPYFFDHRDAPLEYPCLVQSIWGDDPNGPYYYDHHFVYVADAARLVYMSLFDLMQERDYYKKLYEELLETKNENATISS